MLLDKLGKPAMFFEADGGGGGGGAGGEGDGEGNGSGGGESSEQAEELVYDDWFGQQPDEVKSLLDEHTSGLKSALGSEREARREAQKQLRAVADDLKEGSEARGKLTKLADDFAEAEAKTDFYEQAHGEGVTDLKLAYIVAKEEGLIDKRGKVDFTKMKEAHSSLFVSKKRPPGHGGQGAGGEGSGQPKDMNAAIRAAAGRK